MWDFLIRIMEVLDKDNKIRNAIPITVILWVACLYMLYVFTTEVGFPFYKLLAEANSKPIDSWSTTNIAVIVFIVLNGFLFLYLAFSLAMTRGKEVKASKAVDSLEEGNSRVQEMLDALEEQKKKENEEYEKAKSLAQEAQSMVDELKKKPWDKS